MYSDTLHFQEIVTHVFHYFEHQNSSISWNNCDQYAIQLCIWFIRVGLYTCKSFRCLTHNVLCWVYLVLSGLGMKMWCTVIYCRCCLFILKYIHDSFYCKLNDEYIQDEFPTFISLYVESYFLHPYLSFSVSSTASWLWFEGNMTKNLWKCSRFVM